VATPETEAVKLGTGELSKDKPQQAHKSLWVTVIPPSVLEVGNSRNPSAIVTEEVEVPSRALGHLIGAKEKGLQEMELHSGAKASVKARGEGESHAHMVFEGTRAQITAAKAVLEQKLVMAIGAAKVEKLQKHYNSEFLAMLNSQSGVDAASGGVKGLLEFAEKWKLSAVLVRKLKKLDAMTQRYLIRHFKPLKAKPANALRSYVTTLLMPPQRWRLQSLFEDGELEGEVCETAVVEQAGAVVGRQQPRQEEADMEAFLEEVGESTKPKQDKAAASDYELAPGEQLIELEFDVSMGEREASRLYGDVQPYHCRLLRMGEDFYVWALEVQIGTVVDSKKYRQTDGPTPIRDGTVVAIGRYLLYCEVGEGPRLQERRKKLLAGESFWKIMKEMQFASSDRPSRAAVQGEDQGDQSAWQAPEEEEDTMEAAEQMETAVDGAELSDSRGVKRKSPEEDLGDGVADTMLAGADIDFSIAPDGAGVSTEAEASGAVQTEPANA
jgi:hypothetical protein